MRTESKLAIGIAALCAVLSLSKTRGLAFDMRLAHALASGFTGGLFVFVTDQRALALIAGTSNLLSQPLQQFDLTQRRKAVAAAARGEVDIAAAHTALGGAACTFVLGHANTIDSV